MTFSDAVRSGFDHYTKFDGRAARPTFWYWVLFAIAVGIAANVLDAGLGTGPMLSLLVSLGLFLPGLSVAIRRLHDTGRSGYWVLIGLIPIIGLIMMIVFCAEEGDSESNEYGAVPEMHPPSAPAPTGAG